MLDVAGAVAAVRAARVAGRTLLVAVSGIDAAGKGYVAHRIANTLRPEEVRVAVLTPDAWLTPFASHREAPNPAEHYYQHHLQFADLCRMLLDPLKETGTVRLTSHIDQRPGVEWVEYGFELERVDVVLLESVFLLTNERRGQFDLTFWVECGWETALQRAQRRSLLGELDEELVREYRTIRFPAQEIHLDRDRPREHADGVIDNDPRPDA